MIDLMKIWDFLEAVIVWCHHIDASKRMERKLDYLYTRMIHAVLNKAWKQHTTKQVLRGLLFSIWNPSKTNKARLTLLEKQGHTHKRLSSVDRYTWIHQCLWTCQNSDQFCADTGSSVKNILLGIADRETHVISTTTW